MSKRRNPNFTAQEIEVLLEEVEKHKGLLFSKLSNVATNSAKQKKWEAICNSVNASTDSGHTRSVEEIRKKWTCYMSSSKKKIAALRRESRKTGGGPSSETSSISNLDEMVASIIGDTPIEGIEGGIDTLEVAKKPRSSVVTSPMQGTSSSFIRLDDNDDSEPDTSMKRPSPVKPKKALSLSPSSNESATLVDIERKRLNIEEEKLAIKKQRIEIEKQKVSLTQELVQIEKERLEVESRRFLLEQAKQQLYLAQLQSTMPQLSSSLTDSTH